jgi:hypothetical protein
MWVILLLFLVPVSWIATLLCWIDWQYYLATGVHRPDAMYAHPIGLLAIAYVALQVLFLVDLARNHWK